jgi:hypothetical protein
VRTGKCKLCLQTRELCDSHLLPKAMYELLRETTPDYAHPTIITKGKTYRTSAQCRAFAFCHECEHRLNVSGEAYMVRLVSRKGSFPFLEMLGNPSHIAGQLAYHTLSSDTPIDRDKVGYYGLSIFWRSSAVRWSTRSYKTISIILGKKYNEAVRVFLLGMAPIPNNVFLAVTACTDSLARRCLCVPTVSLNSRFSTYAFNTLGVLFQLAIGKAVPEELKRTCFLPSSQPRILVRDCEGKLVEGMRPLLLGQKTIL